MANTLLVNLADCPADFPLRGDMDGARLDFTPTGKKFRVRFFTKDAKTYFIRSNARPFLGLQDQLQTEFSFGGRRGMYVEFGYNVKAQAFELIAHNIDGGAGTGDGTGTALTLTVDSTETVAPGVPASVENVGTDTNIRLKFKVPKGDPGADSTGGGQALNGLPPGGDIGQIVVKTGAGNYAAGWANPPSGAVTGGGAGGFTAELALQPDENGNVEINAALGNNFRIVLTRNIKIKNPVGYENSPGLLRIKLVQGAGGPWTADWESQWAHPDGQPPALASDVGAIQKVTSDMTDNSLWLTDISPPGNISAGYAGITPIARIGSVYYYRMYGTLVIPASTTAMGAAKTGDTIVVLRNGKGGEVTGTVVGQSVTVTGALQGGGRALLSLGVVEYGQGQVNRPSFNKALLNFEGDGASEVRDIRITKVRNEDGDARGIAPNGGHSLTVRNVEVTDCNNGMMWGSGMTGFVHIYDSLFDGNGVGSPDIHNSHGTGRSDGYVHNIYAGETGGGLLIERSSFTNAATGHDIKSRAAVTVIRQTIMRGAKAARELDLPYGGDLLVEDSIIHKVSGSSQGNLITIGGEGTDTSRPRQYIFRNCRFIMDYGSAGQDATFMANKDPSVPVRYIDCEWIGDYTKTVNSTGSDSFYAGMTTVGGERYFVPPIIEFTNGPVGPRADKPVGYFPVANTAIPA